MKSCSNLIIFENSDYLVVNKPAGISVHCDDKVPGLVAELQQQRQYNFLAPCHRLDKVTSGCLILAKNPAAAAHLGDQFANHKVGKIYFAITQGKAKKKQGVIRGDMQKSRGGNWKLCQSQQQPAITRFRSLGFEENLRMAILQPLTGKTHQLRVAMKSNGTPIVGDSRYGGMDADRCYLHCWQMQFYDRENQWLSVNCLPQQGHYFQSPQLTRLIATSVQQFLSEHSAN